MANFYLIAQENLQSQAEAHDHKTQYTLCVTN